MSVSFTDDRSYYYTPAGRFGDQQTVFKQSRQDSSQDKLSSRAVGGFLYCCGRPLSFRLFFY